MAAVDRVPKINRPIGIRISAPAIGPRLTEQQQMQADKAARNRGLTTGFAAGIELRHVMLVTLGQE